ncbi:hypothetical protein FOVSG1_006655 [Fusarium oxysporum f. sp. vasinfectum]
MVNTGNTVPLYPALDAWYPSTRLLVLLPGQLEDSIQCDLLVVNLDDSPHYEALSYVWGGTTQKLTVTIAGKPVVVTDNLHAALYHLRYPDRDRVLWVDALCINQSDDREKMQQVGMMGKIFQGSLHCLVWLGEISTVNDKGLRYTVQDAKAAFEMIRLITDDEMEGDLPASLGTSTARKGAVNALSGMMIRGNMWWQRVWTVQEAVLPAQKIILWHTDSIPWTKCIQAAEQMVEPTERHRKVIDLLSPELYSFDVNEFITPFLSLELTKEEEYPLFTAHRWRYREATDPRDKVYGLLGLINRAHVPSINCDYALSAVSVFTKFTLDLIRFDESLSPLLGWRGELHATPGLPTWALDMVRPSPLVNWGCKFWEHFDRYRFFSADGCSKLVLATRCDESVLALKGLIVDTVCLVDEGIAVDERVILPNEDFARVIERRQQLLDKFIKDFPGKAASRSDWKNAFWKTMLGDAVTLDERVTRRATPEDADLFDQFLKDWQWNEAAESLRSMVLNQAFFITQSGYLGIGPPHTRSGDVVCIFSGGRVPFILRSTEGDLRITSIGNSWTFIGDSFVQGIMDGELFPPSQNKIQDVLLV